MILDTSRVRARRRMQFIGLGLSCVIFAAACNEVADPAPSNVGSAPEEVRPEAIATSTEPETAAQAATPQTPAAAPEPQTPLASPEPLQPALDEQSPTESSSEGASPPAPAMPATNGSCGGPGGLWVLTRSISDCSHDGPIQIGADNVRLERVHVTNGWVNAYVPGKNYTGHAIVDSLIEGDGQCPASAVNLDMVSGSTLRGCSDGIKVRTGGQILDNHIGPLASNPGDHNDGIQAQAGHSIVVRGNTIDSGGFREGRTNGGIFFKEDSGPIQAVVEDNHVSGFGFCIYVYSGDVAVGGNNTFGECAFGTTMIR